MEDLTVLPYLFAGALLTLVILDKVSHSYTDIKIQVLETTLKNLIQKKDEHPMIEYFLTQFTRLNLELHHVILFFFGFERMAIDSYLSQSFSNLSLNQFQSLTNSFIQRLYRLKQLSLSQILELKTKHLKILSSSNIQALILNRHLSVAQALNLTSIQKRCLQLPNIFRLIDHQKLNIEDALMLDTEEFLLLSIDLVTQLIMDDLFTVEQILNLNHQQQFIVTRTNFRQLMLLGFLNVADLYHIPNLDGPQIYELNHPQNTHTASIHESVAQSALKLNSKYPIYEVDTILTDITTALKQQPNIAHQACALNCLERLTKKSHHFIEPQSKISLRQLIALSYLSLGAHLKAQHDVLEQLSQSLYEIQRGYNLSEHGIDDRQPDRPICLSGAFNKLIERLQGIEPLCEIRHITPAVASLKFKAIVQQQTEVLLQKYLFLNKASDCIFLSRLLINLQRDGIESIWPLIKIQCVELLQHEFSSLFTSPIDPKLQSIVQAGGDMPIQLMFKYQKTIIQSDGYHNYLNSLLKQNTLFFNQSPPSKEEWACIRHQR